jgi:type IV secretion system protein VirB10
MSNSVEPTKPPVEAENWEAQSSPVPTEDIVSVNSKKSSADSNRVAKSLFILLSCAILVGLLVWFSQNWLTQKKQQLRPETAKSGAPGPDLMNPEKTGNTAALPKLGSASGNPPPSQPAQTRPGEAESPDGIRPIRGNDGKLMVNAQGRAMGVDRNGNVVEVPAIAAITTDPAYKKPLPGQASGAAGGQTGGGTPPPKPPSRYGGSLFVANSATGSSGTNRSGANSPTGAASGPMTVEKYLEALKSVSASLPGAAASPISSSPPSIGSGTFGLPGASTATPQTNNAASGRAGSIDSALYSSATPVARAKRFPDQNLVLPKGRQADCILTGRIIDEVPGFTSCVLAQNLYSDNGRVLLLERGSELSGEYGIMNQPGQRRLFVTWNRVKTPEGIEVDLSSPGSDPLGTSGIPGYLDNRWAERIGAALIISFLKDVSVAVINNQANKSANGTSITIQQPQPAGQNTVNAGFSIADEVVKQTLKVRPTLSINEGDRIAIYIARDLDFTPVYDLKITGAPRAIKVN